MTEQIVWVALYDHKHGTDVGVYDSEEAAYAYMALEIRRFYWREVLDAQLDSDPNRLPANPPTDDEECVSKYFAVMSEQFEPETFLIEQRSVLSMPEIAKK